MYIDVNHNMNVYHWWSKIFKNILKSLKCVYKIDRATEEKAKNGTTGCTKFKNLFRKIT